MKDNITTRVANRLLRIVNRERREIIRIDCSTQHKIENTARQCKKLLNYIQKNNDTLEKSIVDIPTIRESTVRHITRQLESTEKICRNIISTLNYNEYDQIDTTINLRSMYQEVRAIENAFKKVEYKHGILSVWIYDVVLEDGDEEVCLGDFKISLDTNNTSKDRYISDLFTVTGENNMYSSNGYIHPHIKNAKLCFGDGLEICSTAFLQGRIEDVFILIESIIRTYNDESPYESLDEWLDKEYLECDQCGANTNEDESCLCEDCRIVLCCTCSKKYVCESCGDILCDSCCFECKNKNCGNNCCLCLGCVDSCVICGENFHAICEQLDDSFCECIMCELCAREYCHKCLDCGTIDVCENCEHVCNTCGVSSCERCYEKHQCLLLEVNNV